MKVIGAGMKEGSSIYAKGTGEPESLQSIPLVRGLSVETDYGWP